MSCSSTGSRLMMRCCIGSDASRNSGVWVSRFSATVPEAVTVAILDRNEVVAPYQTKGVAIGTC